MPRYYRRRYVRYSRRRRSGLSTRSIFSRKGASAQANQIYALRRRVNKVYRRCKPEIKSQFTDSGTFEFNSSATGSVWRLLSPEIISSGTGNDSRTGNFIRCKDSYNLSFEYYNNSTTGYHDSESSGTQIRMILFQSKEPVSSNPQPSDILANWGTTGSDYDCLPVTGFKTGVTNKYRIMKDTKFTLTTDRNQKIVKVTSPWYSQRFVGTNSNHTFLLIIGCGLHWDTNFTERVKASRFTKTVFYDL